MGLRCLLSHDFGEAELEREREEQGNEVVITVNEVKTCTRCGERRVVSENTEVTSIDQLTDTATAADSGAAQATVDAASATAAQPGSEPAGETADPAAAAAPADTPTADTGITIDESTTDDAEIIDDGPAADSEPAADEPEDLGTAEPDNM